MKSEQASWRRLLLELGLEGRVGVRQVKKGGKQDELGPRLQGPIGLPVIAPTSTKVPAAAGLQKVLPQAREVFKR